MAVHDEAQKASKSSEVANVLDEEGREAQMDWGNVGESARLCDGSMEPCAGIG